MEFISLMMVRKTQIPFTKIDSIPLLVKDFLEGRLPGFSDVLFSQENIRRKISAKAHRFDDGKRRTLVSVIREQYEGIEMTSRQQENLDRLLKDNSFTVVTGHQLNLFSGPVFFVYKILQTIKTAELLNVWFPEQHIVPVFWMATEDHDFEEINHFRTRDAYYSIRGKSGGPVGKIKVEDQFFIHEFEKEFKDSVYRTELIRWIKEAYQTGNTLAGATRILVNRLFAEYGLLCIDGDHPALKSQMKNIFREELLHQKLFATSRKNVDFLTARYGKVQVNPRHINLFYLSDTRDRIDTDGQTFYIVGKNLRFTEDELLQQLERYPERFSPNALMRPVFQETVLPNLAYIGGNAEIMYWMELKDYFKAVGLVFPVLIPRNSMVCLPGKIFEKIERLDLRISDFFKNFAVLIRTQIQNNEPLEDLLKKLENVIHENFSILKQDAGLTDITFKNLVEAEETRQLKSYTRMHKRLLRAQKIKQSERLERIERIFYDIHPGKTWQERVYNFSVFYADMGREWLQNCYQEMDAEQSALVIMQI